MSLTGKNTLSLRKKDVKEQRSLALGFKKLVFAHKASLGATGIDLGSLITPSEMSSLGFVNASTADLQAANLLFYKNNLTLTSSSRNLLMQDLSYTIKSNSRIEFQGFTALEGEIFIGVVDASARTANPLVDARPIVATGTLAIGVTDFSVGTPFRVNHQSNSQVGEVVVYRNGMQQFRNVGNTSTGDGNYYEVQAGNGLGTVIRFNEAPSLQADNIMVISNGLIAERPDGSMMAVIESLAGQLDQVIPTVAALAGQPETNYQAAPNNVDLKQFGDQVIDHEQRITALESTPDVIAIYKGASGTLAGSDNPISFSTMVRDTHSAFAGDTFTTPAGKSGSFDFTINLNLNGTMSAGTLIIVTPYINGVAYFSQVEVAGGASGNLYPKMLWKSVALTEGDEVVFQINTTMSGAVYGGGANLNVMTITRTGG